MTGEEHNLPRVAASAHWQFSHFDGWSNTLFKRNNKCADVHTAVQQKSSAFFLPTPRERKYETSGLQWKSVVRFAANIFITSTTRKGFFVRQTFFVHESLHFSLFCFFNLKRIFLSIRLSFPLCFRYLFFVISISC